MKWQLRRAFFIVSEDDIARFIEETKNKNTLRKTNQDLGLFKAAPLSYGILKKLVNKNDSSH